MRPESTSNGLVLPAPFGPMMPSTSPRLTCRPMPCRNCWPPRSSAISRQPNRAAGSVVQGCITGSAPPGRLLLRGLLEIVRDHDLVLLALHLHVELAHARLQRLCRNLVAVVGEMRCL